MGIFAAGGGGGGGAARRKMGNRFICMTKKDAKDGTNTGSRSKRMGERSSKRRSLLEEELLHRQALSMAIQQHQLSQRFDGSMSRRIGSTSSRRRNNLSDSFSNSTKQVTLLFFFYIFDFSNSSLLVGYFSFRFFFFSAINSGNFGGLEGKKKE